MVLPGTYPQCCPPPVVTGSPGRVTAMSLHESEVPLVVTTTLTIGKVGYAMVWCRHGMLQ